MPRTRNVYQLRITLQDIQPPIWRRIQVWEDVTLAQLHTTLQIVMDWEDYHLHEFSIGKRIYSVPDPEDDLYERTVIDESSQRLSDVVLRVGTTFTYLYDFGDNPAYVCAMHSWITTHDVAYQTISDYCPHGVWRCGGNPGSARAYRQAFGQNRGCSPPA